MCWIKAKFTNTIHTCKNSQMQCEKPRGNISERGIQNSDELIQFDYFTFVIFKGVCLHI